MKIVVVSDTHGNVPLLQSVVDFAATQQGVSQIWHLGDDYADCNAIDPHGLVLWRVPGTRCAEYFDGSGLTHCFEIEGFPITLVHTPEDAFYRAPQQSSIVFYGHLHTPAITKRRNILFINPGHLKSCMDRRYPATFIIADIQHHLMTLSQFDYQNKLQGKATIRHIDGNNVLESIEGQPIGWSKI